MDQYQQFIHTSKYARWRESDNRRETFEESVDRYLDYFDTYIDKTYKYSLRNDIDTFNLIRNEVITLGVMPSMRALATAGAALESDHCAAYNCAYVHVDNMRVFSDMIYILIHGVGCGYSVEKRYINKLPEVPEVIRKKRRIHVAEDSKKGWAMVISDLISSLYSGIIIEFDLSNIRPKGAKLKTFGGYAPGPEPLRELIDFIINIFVNARGRKLTPLECHDICCKIGEITVSGGNRRSALISLSDLDDDEMRICKSGEWYNTHKHRAMSNNSACYVEKPSREVFNAEWQSLFESRSGERGIFNRDAAARVLARNGRRDTSYELGCNPCSEILLRSKQFCNLTEVVIREKDNVEDIKRKIKVATILGTFQSTLTDFKFIDPEWKINCEEERLLGVSLTGIYDNKMMYTPESASEVLPMLREYAIKINEEWADRLGINRSAAITCVKPSGTVSQLCNTASGIHPRHSKFYWRSVRLLEENPLTKLLEYSGLEKFSDGTKNTVIFKFPIKSPRNCMTRDDVDAISHLKLWLVYSKLWCEHKPSITVTIRPDEWAIVADWVYEHFDEMSGVSFLPYDCGTYLHPPYETISKKRYNKLRAKMPAIDFNKLKMFERTDNTTSLIEFACTANGCENV